MKMKKILAVFVAAASIFACKPEDVPIPIEVSVSPASVTFEADGGTLHVALSTNAESFSISGTPAWLSIEQNGMEVAITAEANKVKESRSANLTVSAGSASCSIEVIQKPGSPYIGYTMMSSAVFEYAGTMLYQFMAPEEGYDGGQGYIELADEDGNRLSAWVYTELFESEEAVNLTPGKYTKGDDVYMALKAKKLTYMTGSMFSLSGEGGFMAGTYYYNNASETETGIVDGTIEVFEEDGETVIKVDMVDSEGNEYKLVYMGEVEIDTEGATYPGGSNHIDVGTTVFAADCVFDGDYYENGTSRFVLALYSGDEENPAVSYFEFITDAVEFSESMDLSGEYSTPTEADEEEGIEAVEPLSPGSLVAGELVELFPGFSMPQGTYIMYDFGDYLIADAFASLQLTKQEDGTYTLFAAMASTEPNFVFFPTLEGLQINLIDRTSEE